MADNEDKVLLVLDGQAEGLKAAAKEGADSVRQLAADVQAASAQQAAAQEQVDAAFDAQADAAMESASAQKAAIDEAVEAEIAAAQERNAAREQVAAEERELQGLLDETATSADGLGSKTAGARGFAQAIGKISPEAAEAARSLKDVGEAIEFIKSPGGMEMIGAVVVVAALAGAAKQATEELRRTNEELDKFMATQARLRGQTIERQAGVSEALAKQGKGSQASFEKATAESRRMEDMGYDPGVARQTAAAAVDENGSLAMTPDEEELLAAGLQAGMIEIGGKTEAEQAASMRKALATIRRQPGRFQQAAVAIKRPLALLKQGASENRPAEMAAMLKRAGYTDGDAEQLAKDIAAHPTGAQRPGEEWYRPGEKDALEWMYTKAFGPAEYMKDRESFDRAERAQRALGNSRSEWGREAEQAPRTPQITITGGTIILNSTSPQPVKRMAGG